jgi:hypothetical protein
VANLAALKQQRWIHLLFPTTLRGLNLCIVQQGKGSLKAATAVNVRHILCEKHGKAMEALQKIQVVDPLS